MMTRAMILTKRMVIKIILKTQTIMKMGKVTPILEELKNHLKGIDQILALAKQYSIFYNN